jgi:hypothetical protein
MMIRPFTKILKYQSNFWREKCDKKE